MLENLQEQLSKTDVELERLKSLAIDLGASETNLHLSNVVKIIEKAVKEKLEADERARSAGYKSVLIALKAVGQKQSFSHVPSELTVAPSHWVVPRSISEIRVGGKTVTRTNPAVSAIQAQGKLKKLLPLIDEFCEVAEEEKISELKSSFYSMSFDEFSTELMKLTAMGRGRGADGADKTEPSQDGPPIGELILSYERLCFRWMKSQSDFDRFVKDAKRPMRMDLVETAAEIDSVNDNSEAETAKLLITTAFWELAEIDLLSVTGYEMSHPNQLPTSGKEMLHRLRKIGLGPSIKEYQEAFDGVTPQLPSQ